MLLSRPSQYAITGMLRLAALPPGGFCRVEDLVRGTAAPRHAVAKVFHTLARRNLLDSVRGAGGGFRLNSRSLDLSLMEVIEAVEGPFEPAVAMERGLCSRDEVCPMHRLLQPLEEELRRVLRTTRMRDLLDHVVPSAPAGCCTCCGGGGHTARTRSTSPSESTSSQVEQPHEHEST